MSNTFVWGVLGVVGDWIHTGLDSHLKENPLVSRILCSKVTRLPSLCSYVVARTELMVFYLNIPPHSTLASAPPLSGFILVVGTQARTE